MLMFRMMPETCLKWIGHSSECDRRLVHGGFNVVIAGIRWVIPYVEEKQQCYVCCVSLATKKSLTRGGKV